MPCPRPPGHRHTEAGHAGAAPEVLHGCGPGRVVIRPGPLRLSLTPTLSVSITAGAA